MQKFVSAWVGSGALAGMVCVNLGVVSSTCNAARTKGWAAAASPQPGRSDGGKFQCLPVAMFTSRPSWHSTTPGNSVASRVKITLRAASEASHTLDSVGSGVGVSIEPFLGWHQGNVFISAKHSGTRLGVVKENSLEFLLNQVLAVDVQ